MASPTCSISIVGVGQSAVMRKPEVSPVELGLQACIAAIKDAGLQASDIDGVITQQSRFNPQANASPLLAQRLGIQPSYVNEDPTSGEYIRGKLPPTGCCRPGDWRSCGGGPLTCPCMWLRL